VLDDDLDDEVFEGDNKKTTTNSRTSSISPRNRSTSPKKRSNSHSLREKPIQTKKFDALQNNSISLNTSNHSNNKNNLEQKNKTQSRQNINSNSIKSFKITASRNFENNAFALGNGGQNVLSKIKETSKKNNGDHKSDEDQNKDEEGRESSGDQNNGEGGYESGEDQNKDEEGRESGGDQNNGGDDDDFEDVNDDKNSREKKNTRRRKSKKRAKCFEFFKPGVPGVHPRTKRPCKFYVCQVKMLKKDEDGREDLKECEVKFVESGSTSHLNEHLYDSHKMKEFKPPRLEKPNDLELNKLIAKFIVSSNSAIRICDDKYLKVII
jgi:hypothetical protein